MARRVSKASKSPMSSDSSYIAFWRSTDPYGIYNQWSISDFTLTDIDELPSEITSLALFADYPEVIENLTGIEVNCAEQFMMLGKAFLFGDDVTADLIKNEKSPRNHKALGRRVRNFDDDIWTKYCEDIVTLGSYLKFSQNFALKEELIQTGNATLVEGSPYDRIWGVGLRFDSPHINDPSKWKGENKLGKCLMRVRDILTA
jgi:ribA/ribD-fused uncharacterized protein